MEEKQELKDILINEDESKSGAPKKILLFAAAGVLVFVFAIFLVYAINSGGEKEEQKDEQKQQEIVPADGKVEDKFPALAPKEPGGEGTSFEQVPIEPNKGATEGGEKKFEDIIREIKEKNLPAPPEPKAEPKQEKKVTEQQKPTPAPTPAPTQKESAPSKPAQTSGGEVSKGFYIQVGANVKSEPDKKFLAKITEAGYGYRLQHITKDGNEIVRTLVGPYAARSEAKEALSGVQQNITAGAFILEIK